MDARQMETLIQRLVMNPHDEEALAYAHQAGQADPRTYAILLEKVGLATADPAYAAHWLSESANVWAVTVGDAHHAARTFMAAIDKDPTSSQAADRLASLYRERNEQKPLVALLEKLAKMLTPLVASQPDVRPRLAAVHEELGRLWADPPLSRKDRALENWRKVAELDATNVFAIYQTRELLKEAEQFAEALPFFAMEQAVVDDVDRKLALYRDESQIRLRAGDGPGSSQALRQARGLVPDDIGLAQEFGASVTARIAQGENVPPVEREEAKAIFVTLAETYDGEYGFGYAESALACTPGDDRAMQLAAHYGRPLGKDAQLKPLFAAYLAANPNGYLAQEARAAVGSRPPPPPAPPGRGSVPVVPTPGPGYAAPSGPGMPPHATPEQTGSSQPGRGSHAAFAPTGEPSSPDAFASPDTNELRSLLDQANAEAQKGRKPTALAKYRDVLKLDPANTEALAWVDEHLRQKRMYADLRDVLMAASRVLSQSQDTRKAQLRDVAGLCETQLRDLDTAITAAKQIVQIDRGDEQAREQLRRLLEKAQRWDDLATVLEQDATTAPDLETKINLEKKLATMHEQKRKDPGAAAEAWSRIAALSPGDESVIQTAIKLFEKAEQWQMAAAVVADNVSSVEDAIVRANLLSRLGELRLKTEEPGLAADAFAEAAEGKAGKAEGDAKILAEAGKLWEQAEKAYVDAERFIEAANAIDQRAKLGGGTASPELLARAAALYEQSGDLPGAIDKLSEACRNAPEDDALADKLESLFRTTERMEDLVAFLSERATKISDKARRKALRFKTAEVQRDLGESDGARETLLLVLNDGEDERALEWLATDAASRGDHQDHADLLRRLITVTPDAAKKLELSLREATLQADTLDDPKKAIECYETIVRDLDPKSQLALHAIADLSDKLGDDAGAARALERELALVSGEERVELAQRVARLYEGPLDDPKAAIRALDLVLESDPGDLDATERQLKLCEREEQWDRVAKLMGVLIEFEGDDDEASKMTRQLAEVLEAKLGKGDEALGSLEKLADQGDKAARDAYVELGDRLGWKGVVATKLITWNESAAMPIKITALRGAFDRFIEIGREHDAAKVALDLAKLRVADRDLGEKLEQIAIKTKDLDALGAAHEILAKELSGEGRAGELVRQAEVMVQAGADPLDAMQHGEAALMSVPPGEVEPLLSRLAVLTNAPGHIVDLYERQVGRCKSPGDRLVALGRAAQVAYRRGAQDRAKSFFELAIASGVQEDTLEKLEEAARAGDAEGAAPKGAPPLRRVLAEALASGGQGSRDGGRTRAALLRRAATIGLRELNDPDKAFGWIGDALVTYVDDATLAALDELGAQVGDLERVEKTLARALDEVFDGPLVRKLLGRRARLRRDELEDFQGAAADLKKLHDLSPSDQEVMNELSGLLESLGDHRGMIQLYEDQILRGRDPAQRAELARKVARLWEEEVGDAREAADAWRRVLRMKANDPEATTGLERAKTNKLNHHPRPRPALPVSKRKGPAPASKPGSASPPMPPSSLPAIVAPLSSAGGSVPAAASPSVPTVTDPSNELGTTGPNEVFKGISEETADSDEAEEALADVPRTRAHTSSTPEPNPTLETELEDQAAVQRADLSVFGTPAPVAVVADEDPGPTTDAPLAEPEAPNAAWQDQAGAWDPSQPHDASQAQQQQQQGWGDPQAATPEAQQAWAQQQAWVQQQQQQQPAWDPSRQSDPQAWAQQQQWAQQGWQQGQPQQGQPQPGQPQQGWPQPGQPQPGQLQQGWPQPGQPQQGQPQQGQPQGWPQQGQQGWPQQGQPQQGQPQQGGWPQQGWPQQPQGQQGWPQQPQEGQPGWDPRAQATYPVRAAEAHAWAQEQAQQAWAQQQAQAAPLPPSAPPPPPPQRTASSPPGLASRPPPGASRPPPPPRPGSLPPADEDIQDVDDAELLDDD